MKILNVRMDLLYKVTNIIIGCERGQERVIERLLQGVGTIDQDKDYEIIIRPKKRKRSLDANAYMWVLIGKLVEVMTGQTETDIYKKFIHECGVFQIVPIKYEAIKQWTDNWQHNGTGWICEDLGPCANTKGYHNIRCYYGTSVYDSKQMSVLIDSVIEECKAQGIETLSPKKIEHLKQQWKGR